MGVAYSASCVDRLSLQQPPTKGLSPAAIAMNPSYSVIIKAYAGIVALPAIVFAFYAATFCALNKRYRLLEGLRTLLNRLVPAFFIVAPPVITYGLVNGFVSLSFGVFCDLFFFDRISDREAFFLPVFNGFEYVSAVGMGYLWLRVLDWLGLSRIWYLFVLSSHALVGGYRQTRSDFGGAVMGPTVSDHFMFLDALVPFAALLVYGLLHWRKRAA